MELARAHTQRKWTPKCKDNGVTGREALRASQPADSVRLGLRQTAFASSLAPDPQRVIQIEKKIFLELTGRIGWHADMGENLLDHRPIQFILPMRTDW